MSEYYRMADAGIFAPDERVELIDGSVVEMTPISPRHAACVTKLAYLIHDRISTSALIIDRQNPVRLSEHSEPVPDIALLHWRDDFYAAAHPQPKDVLLLIEVADASVMYDRRTKLPLYARAGIAEVWLIDLVNNVVEVCSSPSASSYANQQRFTRGATAASLVLPELQIPVDEILVSRSPLRGGD